MNFTLDLPQITPFSTIIRMMMMMMMMIIIIIIIMITIMIITTIIIIIMIMIIHFKLAGKVQTIYKPSIYKALK